MVPSESISHAPAESAVSQGSSEQGAEMSIDFVSPIIASLTNGGAGGEPVEEMSSEDEVERLTFALASKFEELSLIHQLSDRLKLGADSDQICQWLLEELEICVRAEMVAIELDPDDDFQFEGRFFRAEQRMEPERLRRIAIHTIDMAAQSHGASETGQRAAICNHPSERAPEAVRAVVVPIQRHAKCLGRIIAIRPLGEEEFGTIEADLIKSAAMMLGAHLINQRQYHEIQQMFEGTTQSLVSALDAKDAYTCGHSSRVADLAVELACRLGFDEEGINRIRMAGILHDIGKIGVDDSVLRKPGKLTEVEFEQIKQHPVLGYEILSGIRPFRKILPAVRHHHEAWDGTGYPDGLMREMIPRDAQVLAVADAFDAMTSDRPYRKGMPLERVIEIFREGSGKQWASDVVDALLASPDILVSYATRDDHRPDPPSKPFVPRLVVCPR